MPNTAPHEVWFEEPRDITRLVVEFNDAVPDKLAVSYRRKVWPETHWTSYRQTIRAGSAGCIRTIGLTATGSVPRWR